MGCGAFLQTEQQDKTGYLPKNIMDRGKDGVLCLRCHRLKHYGENRPTDLNASDYLKKMEVIASEDALVLYMIDIMDVYGSFMQGMNRIIGQNDVVLVANKMDLLPSSVKSGKIIHWLKKYAKEEGLKAKDVIAISAKTGQSIDVALEKIKNFAKERNVYVVGATNTGKSSFINQLIKSTTDLVDDVVTVSRFAGTTLDFIAIPLTRKTEIIDTPGLINQKQIAHKLCKKSLDLITPQKTIRPLVYQLEEGQTIFMGGLVRFDFVEGEKSSFVFHIANQLPIHRTKRIRADDVFERMKGSKLVPPFEEEMAKLGKIVKRSFWIPSEGEYDIVIGGIGFVGVKGNKLKIDVLLHETMDVMIRPSML